MHRVKSVLLSILTLVLLIVIVGSASSAIAADNKTYRNPSMPQVELYVTSWCPYCHKAEAYLDRHGIEYRSYDIEKDAAAAKRKDQLDPRRGVPFAMVNGVAIHGWSESAYALALNPQP